MRIRWPACWLALGCIALAGCKAVPASGDGGSEAGLYADEGPYEAPPPLPGTCHALCCSNDDCFTGETCMPFNSAWGTLGVCMGNVPEGGGALPEGGGVFSASCWTFSRAQCNPFTSSQCDAGAACDIDGLVDGGVPSVDCQSGDNEIGPGGACEIENGPFCVPGYHCVPNH